MDSLKARLFAIEKALAEELAPIVPSVPRVHYLFVLKASGTEAQAAYADNELRRYAQSGCTSVGDERMTFSWGATAGMPV